MCGAEDDIIGGGGYDSVGGLIGQILPQEGEDTIL